MSAKISKTMRASMACAFLLAAAAAVSSRLQPLAAQSQKAQAKPSKPKPTPVLPTTVGDTWPAAPQSPPALAETMRPQYKEYLPHLFFHEASAAPPPEQYDLLTSVTTSGAPQGRLLYIEKYGYLYFVLRGINTEGMLNGQPSKVVSYKVQAYWTVFEPEFSPDGQRVLFKIGDPYEATGKYNLFLWDLAAAQVRPASREFITPVKDLTDPASSKLIVADEFGQPNAKYPAALYGEAFSYRKTYWSPNSRWVAYVRSGDRGGRVRRGMQPVQLRLLDVNSGRSRRVVRNPGVTHGEMAWTSQNTLLFTMFPKDKNRPSEDKQERDVDKATDPEPEAPAVPSVFEASTKRGSKPQMVVANAESPLPSPNNRLIAFLRPPADKNKPEQEIGLFDRQGGGVKSLATQKVSFLLWTPDSRQLIAISAFYYGAENGGARGEAIISLIDVASGTQREITTLQAHDYRALSGSEKTAQFDAFKVSQDGRFLFVRVGEATGIGMGGVGLRSRKSLVSVDLMTGNDVTVAQFDDPNGSITGIAWQDEIGSATDNAIVALPAKKR